MQKKKKVKFSIAMKVLISLFIVLTAVFVGIDLYVAQLMENGLLAQYRDSGTKLAASYCMLIEYMDEEAAVEEIMKSNEDLHYVLIVDAEGMVTYATDEEDLGTVYEDSNTKKVLETGMDTCEIFDDEDSRALDIMSPVFKDGEIVGAVNIGIPIDEEQLQESLNQSLKQLMIICILGELIILTIVLLVLFKTVIRPVSRINESVQLVADYNLTEETVDKVRPCLRSRMKSEVFPGRFGICVIVWWLWFPA